MIKFEIGKIYNTRSFCDCDCIFSAKVIKRTEKMITVLMDGVEKRFKVWTSQGVEKFTTGRYSMAPLFSADK